MSFPRYEQYKQSGVEWLGEVPAHWTVERLKFLTSRIGSGKTPLGGNETYQDSGVLFLRSQNVHDDGLRLEDVVCIAQVVDDSMSSSRVQAGDILLNITGASIGRTCIVPQGFPPANVNQHVCVVRVSIPEQATFLAWLLKSAQIKAQIDYVQDGAAREGLNFQQIGSFNVPLPPVSERADICRVLSAETAKIDTLVEEQKRLIELLKEKRQAVISRAVTKGLNPAVPMKDSEVHWLGRIPAHWDAVALKRISPIQTVGIVVNPSIYVAREGLPFLYGGDIREGRIDLVECRRISAEDSERNVKTRLQAGDLVTVRVGAPGVTAVVPHEAEGGNCASVMLIRRGDFDSRWLCYTMNDRVVRFQVEVVQYGAAQEQFNISHAVEFILPRPGRGEQKLIADHLDKATAKLDELVAEALAAMTLLSERRSALIAAAVTGKIGVRGAVALQEMPA